MIIGDASHEVLGMELVAPSYAINSLVESVYTRFYLKFKRSPLMNDGIDPRINQSSERDNLFIKKLNVSDFTYPYLYFLALVT